MINICLITFIVHYMHSFNGKYMPNNVYSSNNGRQKTPTFCVYRSSPPPPFGDNIYKYICIFCPFAVLRRTGG